MIATEQFDLFAHMERMLAFSQAKEARDTAIAQVEENAGELFSAQARAFVVDYLRVHGDTPGETLTDACRAAGIAPAVGDDRCFGAVFGHLSRRGIIVRRGFCLRTKGHLTQGGSIWGLA